MKKSIFILILGLSLNLQSFSQEGIQYPLKEGSIVYTMSMMGTESSMILYFEDYGNTQCSDVNISMFGVSTHNRSIMIDKMAYALDMNAKTYTQIELTYEELKKQAHFLSDETALAEQGITKEGNEEFLGKTCQIYSMSKDGADIKFWSWEGLMLKMETAAQGMSINLIAKSIDESAPEQSWYAIPDDFTLIENTED